MIDTRPSEVRSSSGTETDSNDRALRVGKSARSEGQPAAAGPNNEEILIVVGATTGKRSVVDQLKWVKRVWED